MQKSFNSKYLKGQDFSNRNLRGFSFVDAACCNSDFSGTDLTACNFENARLDGANLKGAIVTGAFIKGACFKGAILPNGQRADSFFGAAYAMAKLGAVFRKDKYSSVSSTPIEKVTGKPYRFYLDWPWLPSLIDVDGNDRRKKSVRIRQSRRYMWVSLTVKQWREPCFWYKSLRKTAWKKNVGGLFGHIQFKTLAEARKKKGYRTFQDAFTVCDALNRKYKLGLVVTSYE